VLKRIRDQTKEETPVPADFLLGPGGTRTVFPLNNISSVLFNRQTDTAPTFAPTPLAGQLLALRSISAGGRGIDLNGDGVIDLNEGVAAAPPIGNRDGLRQTVVDLLQLVREIEVGMDVDGDTIPDLDPSRMYYFGNLWAACMARSSWP
jgi:hypothetical protein